MSNAYSRSVQIASKNSPDPGMRMRTWLKHKQIAGDQRLAAMDPSILPNTFSSLYELSKMSDAVLDWIVRLGVLNPDTPSRLLKSIKVKESESGDTVLEIPLGKLNLARVRCGTLGTAQNQKP